MDGAMGEPLMDNRQPDQTTGDLNQGTEQPAGDERGPKEEKQWPEGAKAKGRRESTWLMHPMDQDTYPEWDLAVQEEWSKAPVREGTWAPERGVDAWQQEQDKM
uniref:Uncharacterized protein n=1 Tax=Sphaerodactylus townsendi TaxID=933632 RepID=A0ACB8FGF2_9SAUR